MVVRSGDFDIFFSTTGSARRAHILIGVATSSDDWRIAAASGKFEGEAAGGRDSGNFSFVIQSGTVDRTSRWNQNTPHSCHAEFWFDAQFSSACFEALYAFRPKIGLR